MTASTPMTPGLAVLFVISVAGILFLILSRSARIKRITWPLTVLVFYAMVFVVLERSGAVGSLPIAAVIAVLAALAAYSWWMVDFCAECGRTITGRGADTCCVGCTPPDER